MLRKARQCWCLMPKKHHKKITVISTAGRNLLFVAKQKQQISPCGRNDSVCGVCRVRRCAVCSVQCAQCAQCVQGTKVCRECSVSTVHMPRPVQQTSGCRHITLNRTSCSRDTRAKSMIGWHQPGTGARPSACRLPDSIASLIRWLSFMTVSRSVVFGSACK